MRLLDRRTGALSPSRCFGVEGTRSAGAGGGAFSVIGTGDLLIGTLASEASDFGCDGGVISHAVSQTGHAMLPAAEAGTSKIRSHSGHFALERAMGTLMKRGGTAIWMLCMVAFGRLESQAHFSRSHI